MDFEDQLRSIEDARETIRADAELLERPAGQRFEKVSRIPPVRCDDGIQLRNDPFLIGSV